ncbi:MAG: tRNA 2-thiouridine(34) synthase MnmA [Actinomycetota bacterium]
MGSPGSVLVAMSGGVDSSVAACLLLDAGYEVLGSHLKLVHTGGVEHGCCGPQAEADARAVADLVGFPFEVADMSEVFEERVISDFVAEHEAGRTPNPCVRCNERIKFGAFLDRAEELGMDHVATGHYVRTTQDGNGVWRLLRGQDSVKDQSYVLHMLGQYELSRSLFPVGELPKEQTRALARRYGLPVASKPDSQELCFAPSGDAGAFLGERSPHLAREGDVVDTSGRVVGRHGGAARYTVGQRRGVGVSTGERIYVTETDVTENRVVVGPASLLMRKGLEADGVNWIAGQPGGLFEADVQFRYRGSAVPAVIEPLARSSVRVEFRSPQSAVTPGQSVVFYSGDEVVGGGTIDTAF